MPSATSLAPHCVNTTADPLMTSVGKTYQWHPCAEAIEPSVQCAGTPTSWRRCLKLVIELKEKDCLGMPQFIAACAETLSDLKNVLRDNGQYFKRYLKFHLTLFISSDHDPKKRWATIILKDDEDVRSLIDWLEHIVFEGKAESFGVRSAA